ncbi:MAG: gephyrin-like molybdotransferase Glp [Candidatus Bipolaricaulia bacterium]
MGEFLEVKGLEEAKRIALSRALPVSDVEQIPTPQGLGRVLAEEVLSPVALPGFARATMDGYAVRASDTFGASLEEPAKLRLAGEVEMGEEPIAELRPGEALAIHTGGALPRGADSVVMLEETETSAQGILVYSPVAPGANVIAEDEDLAKGERLLAPGRRLRAQEIGALLGVGIIEIHVFRRVSVGVIATGDELVPPNERPRPGQVRDINSYALSCQIRELGALAVNYGILPDEGDVLLEATGRGLGECDLVCLSGGSSVGTRDLTLKVMEELGEILVHGISIAPGKPTILAVASSGKLLIGLPGNPASSMIVFHRFVAPIIQKLGGIREPAKFNGPAVRAKLAKKIPSISGREEFIRVRLIEKEDGLYAEPILAQSGIISSLVRADGLVTIPALREGLGEGEEVLVELW